MVRLSPFPAGLLYHEQLERLSARGTHPPPRLSLRIEVSLPEASSSLLCHRTKGWGQKTENRRHRRKEGCFTCGPGPEDIFSGKEEGKLHGSGQFSRGVEERAGRPGCVKVGGKGKRLYEGQGGAVLEDPIDRV